MAKNEDNDDVDEYMLHARKALARRGTKRPRSSTRVACGSGAARAHARASLRARAREESSSDDAEDAEDAGGDVAAEAAATAAAAAPMASTQAAQTALASPAPTVAQTATPRSRAPMPPSSAARRSSGATGLLSCSSTVSCTRS